MKKINDWENVQENGSFKTLTSGGYIAQIVSVTNNEDRQYLEVWYDIAQGDFKGYYKEQYEKFNNWSGRFYRSYKDKAVSMFKGFITSVEKSNQNYEWDWDESKLKGKFIGVVLGEEEYIPQGGKYAGQVRTRLTVTKITDVNSIRLGNFKVPELKKLKQEEASTSTQTNPFASISDDTMPF